MNTSLTADLLGALLLSQGIPASEAEVLSVQKVLVRLAPAPAEDVVDGEKQ